MNFSLFKKSLNIFSLISSEDFSSSRQKGVFIHGKSRMI